MRPRPRRSPAVRARLRAVSHYLVALAFLAKAWDHLEDPAGYGVVIVLCLVAGVFVIVATALHRRIEHRLRRLEEAVFAIEGLVCIALGAAFFAHGKVALPWAWTLVGLANLGVGAYRWQLAARADAVAVLAPPPATTARFAALPAGPCRAVVFSSLRTPGDDGYAAMSARMEELARARPGFLGLESARDADGFGITVSYWESEEAIRAWREHAQHRVAQELGRTRWYERWELRVARVERTRGSVEVSPRRA